MSVLPQLQSIRYTQTGNKKNHPLKSFIICIEQVSINKYSKPLISLSQTHTNKNKKEIDSSHPDYEDWRDSIAYYEVSDDKDAMNGRMIIGNLKVMREKNEEDLTYRSLPMYLPSTRLNISIYQKQKNRSSNDFIHNIANQKVYKKFYISRNQITTLIMADIGNSNSSTESCQPIDPLEYEYQCVRDKLNKSTWHCQIFPKLSAGQELQLNFTLNYDCYNGYLRAAYGNKMGIGNQPKQRGNSVDVPSKKVNEVFINQFKIKVISSHYSPSLEHIFDYSKPLQKKAQITPPQNLNNQPGFFGFFGSLCCRSSQVSVGSSQLNIESTQRKPYKTGFLFDSPQPKGSKSVQTPETLVDSRKNQGQFL